MRNDSLVKEVNVEMAENVFLKYYEYLPYNRRHRESVASVLHSREMGANGTSRGQVRKSWSSSIGKGACFYTRSLSAAKFGSAVKPHFRSITNVNQVATETENRLRPRQFEYHPSDASLMAIGTLDGEVVVVNHETGNVVKYISPCWQMNGILGLCWLKQHPSKLLVGSDDGTLSLYDINHVTSNSKGEGGYCDSTVLFDAFEQLTSVHVNSSDDRCLTSGYSKKVAVYDICTGKRLQLFADLHQEPINVAKFSNHSPDLFVTSSFDRQVKMWDLRQDPFQPCYSASSSRGNVMACFSPDDVYLLVSAIDNEVKQLLAVDGRLHTDFGIVSTGSPHNYTRSYYMNGRDYIISGSCQEPTVRVCCAQTGRRLRDISLEDMGVGSSIIVQSLRSDPFRYFHMAVLAVYTRPSSKYEIVKVDLVSSSNATEGNDGGLNTCSFNGKGG